ncbi:MAG: cysteine-rich small domain-containing protein [Synergistaceae bacterium]|nr:cysteine-rich small domain-containing protein [Synergistaceae bacterium]
MKNSYRFFNNIDCKYFPCHSIPDGADFNCLFCYCPLYFAGDDCGGNFVEFKGVKDCSNCRLPHIPEYYDTIVAKLGEMLTSRGFNKSQSNHNI